MPDDLATVHGLLTPRQVADRLGVTKRTLWRMAKQDGFPQPIRFSRKMIRWKPVDVEGYINALQPADRP